MTKKQWKHLVFGGFHSPNALGVQNSQIFHALFGHPAESLVALSVVDLCCFIATICEKSILFYTFRKCSWFCSLFAYVSRLILLYFVHKISSFLDLWISGGAAGSVGLVLLGVGGLLLLWF